MIFENREGFHSGQVESALSRMLRQQCSATSAPASVRPGNCLSWIRKILIFGPAAPHIVQRYGSYLLLGTLDLIPVLLVRCDSICFFSFLRTAPLLLEASGQPPSPPITRLLCQAYVEARVSVQEALLDWDKQHARPPVRRAESVDICVGRKKNLDS